MATRCVSPPESLSLRSPTMVPYTLGVEAMKWFNKDTTPHFDAAAAQQAWPGPQADQFTASIKLRGHTDACIEVHCMH